MEWVINMIRYGILSTASIVDRFVAGIRESGDGYVQAIASRSLEKAKIAAERLNIDNYYGSYDELFEDDNIDVIYIPTVNGLHYRDCRKALLHHKHVVMEKPFVLHSLEAIELFELAKKQNCFLMEAQKCVFLPTTKKVKELINNNIIGKVKYIEYKAGFPGRFDYDHWMYDLTLGGGALYGSSTYTIESLQYLFDQPDLDIDGTCIKCPTKADEICNFQLKVNHEILVSATIAMNVELKNEAVFYGELGYIVVPYFWKSKGLELHIHGQETQYFDYPYQSEFVYEIKHIHDCLNKGLIESPVMNKEKTIQACQLVEKLYQKWQ
ncbi:oxidoreductase, NAD-binding domain protein [Candidatus Stoquefichus sp. KLE1796]|nr:oxidoreductase, NAD-binding domain protein [Candidatus Stoquefichus sp. KLE1796]